jgi:glycosyltransferase involved in cell wall biosynthesis
VKILWVSPFFLHPVNEGARRRSLGILQCLHRRHEIHFAALATPDCAEGVEHAAEYSARAYPVLHRQPTRSSAAFAPQVVGSIFNSTPLSISRYTSRAMKRQLRILIERNDFDVIVADTPEITASVPHIGRCVVFTHGVYAMLWDRHTAVAATPVHRWYFRLQARRMRRYERIVYRECRQVIAVSEIDAQCIRQMCGIEHVSTAPTGVDVDFFSPPAPVRSNGHVVFIGSMDWLPNIDGVLYFTEKILPLIRLRIPDCGLTIAGRFPDERIRRLAVRDRQITVTGTVEDIRPYLWHAGVAIVPLRIGDGTRLKVYEAMAAKVPVVSTSIGAEGLDYADGQNILIADDPQRFAGECVRLLRDRTERERISAAAWRMVTEKYSWEAVTQTFERILEQTVAVGKG